MPTCAGRKHGEKSWVPDSQIPVCKEKASTETLREWKGKRTGNHALQGQGLLRGVSVHPPEHRQSPGPALKGGRGAWGRPPGLGDPRPIFKSSSHWLLHLLFTSPQALSGPQVPSRRSEGRLHKWLPRSRPVFRLSDADTAPLAEGFRFLKRGPRRILVAGLGTGAPSAQGVPL